MKFRNKATKEIRKAEMRDDGIYLYSETAEEWRKCDWEVLAKYWEEYREEPKEYWYIYAGNPQRADCIDILEEDFKAIGNYFETKEEAELALRKLKAWKRLKDKGFRFINYDEKRIGIDLDYISITALAPRDKELLDLLFGGEE